MKSYSYKIYALSENALTLQLASKISEEQIRFLYHIRKLIIDFEINSIDQILVTFHELTVFYNSSLLPFESLKEKIHKTIDMVDIHTIVPLPDDANQFFIPVCYDKEVALDSVRLENHTGFSFAEIIQRHLHGNYTFFMMGFLPGFLYLGGLDRRLACPRLAEPRLKVLAGSVGIAGEQTGIYPIDSPGGWNIVGRTPLALFDFDQSILKNGNSAFSDVMIQPLDNINFISISSIQFQELQGMTIREYQKSHKTK